MQRPRIVRERRAGLALPEMFFLQFSFFLFFFFLSVQRGTGGKTSLAWRKFVRGR